MHTAERDQDLGSRYCTVVILLLLGHRRKQRGYSFFGILAQVNTDADGFVHCKRGLRYDMSLDSGGDNLFHENMFTICLCIIGSPSTRNSK